METTALSFANFFKTEFATLIADIEHIWTDDVLPFFSKFGAWGVGITKNILHDLEGVVVAGVDLAKQLTGAALKDIWTKVIVQVKAAVGGAGSFADKLWKIRDAIFSTIDWGSVWQTATKIGYQTVTSMITGFLSMALAGAL